MPRIAVVVLFLMFTYALSAEISAKLMRYMDVSSTQIVFVYGGDIWLVPKEGGTAMQVTHSPGEESWPRFSPDGKTIAFTASYRGNMDVYTMPVTGGIPHRVTYHSSADRTIDWHPDGDHILFASRRELGQRSSRQFFMVHKDGGLAEKIDIPYGELASFSPDGSQLAYITKITERYPFKRYRGGLASDILIYDFEKGEVSNITDNPANDGKPAWAANKLYFLSDRGSYFRRNLWSYDSRKGSLKQVTKFKDFDISFLSAGPEELVFEVGGDLFLLDQSTESYRRVEVHVVSDLSLEMSRKEDVSGRIRNMSASPKGNRIVFEARGELFNVPVKEGYSVNLTRSSGAFDHSPAWSPNGRHIAFWSDRDGEYQIYLSSTVEPDLVTKITNRNQGFGYTLFWSPDSKRLAFVDEKNDLNILDIGKDAIVADNLEWNLGHGSRAGFKISWSPDSKWITYAKNGENTFGSIHVYHVQGQTTHQVTTSYFDDSNPVFSKDGKYIFYMTNRNLSAAYSDMGDGTWIYPNATQIAAINLLRETPSLLEVRNDTIVLTKEKSGKRDDDEEKATSNGEDPKKPKKDKVADDERPGEADSSKDLRIDFEEMEARVTILPLKAGNIGSIIPFKDRFVYVRYPNTGSGDRIATLMLYDLKTRKEKKVMSDVQAVMPTADGNSILVRSKGRFGIVKAAPNQKIDQAIPADGLVMDLIPKVEWRQIFEDTWRRHRDFFYDPNMHGVDWNELKNRYYALLEDARTRWDVTNIQSNLVAELSAGHTYTNGGDVEVVKPVETGFLGIDWAVDELGYKIKRIVRPAIWDTDVRSPFDQPGMDIQEDTYILAVNGMRLDLAKDPYAAFEGLAGKTVALEVKQNDDIDSKQVVVKTLSGGQESRLRYLEWREHNRQMVDKLSQGQLGYIYMSNTSSQGQQELVSMYYGQLDKQGFIIDERFNGGGALADRFLELLQRPVVYNLHWRHGKDHTWPIMANPGPMGMLINGWAGSGGDGFPWGFQELKAGPIVGERTLGILVGPNTRHTLIDGGTISVPGARLYDNDGHWFWEGEGVTPDIEVWDDPNLLMQGRDPQIERVVSEVMAMLKVDPPRRTPAPPLEDRTAKGLRK